MSQDNEVIDRGEDEPTSWPAKYVVLGHVSRDMVEDSAVFASYVEKLPEICDESLARKGCKRVSGVQWEFTWYMVTEQEEWIEKTINGHDYIRKGDRRYRGITWAVKAGDRE